MHVRLAAVVLLAVSGARAGADVVRSMYGRRLSRIDKGAADFATAADAVRQWLVDPLCGTLNYAVGNMLVAVNVALRDGAVADPFSGEVFSTDGETAWVRYDGADGSDAGRVRLGQEPGAGAGAAAGGRRGPRGSRPGAPGTAGRRAGACSTGGCARAARQRRRGSPGRLG